ncbi:MAG: phosphatase PAP2 family protein, partial [Thermoanaerobaculia bacterium]
ERVGEVFRVLLFWLGVTWSYSWLKTFLPILNPVTYDIPLDRLDTLLHLGVNPNRFILAFLPFPGWWQFVDFSYALFLPVAVASFGWFVSTLATPERARFSTRFGLLWVLSAWIYLAVPARGPCFVFEGDYMGARASLPNQLRTQGILGHQYSILKKSGRTPGPEFVPGWGTAAMPSLHVGALAFLACWARRRSRRLAFAFCVLTVITFLGSLVTGWHYAIDGYVGILLGIACAVARWPMRGRRERGSASENESADVSGSTTRARVNVQLAR